MSRLTRRTLVVVVVGVGIGVVFTLFCWQKQHADDSRTTPENPNALSLRTDGLPTPIVIPGDSRNRQVTSVEIRGAFENYDHGKGAITLDQSTLAFNEFGDASIEKRGGSMSSDITLRRVQPDEIQTSDLVIPRDRSHKVPTENRRLYEIVFADGSFDKRMYLALSDGVMATHRLIICGGEEPASKRKLYPIHILALRGSPKLAELLPDAPVRPILSLSTLAPRDDPQARGLRTVSIHGNLAGPVRLSLDPNFLSFNIFGDVLFTTAMGYEYIPSKLKPIGIEDPERRGRFVFEIVPEKQSLKSRYYLVLASTQAGPHRLLVRKDDRLQHILSLEDPERRRHLAVQRQLSGVSPEEQKAIVSLRQVIDYRFGVGIESQKVVSLSVCAAAASSKFEPFLKPLTNLRRIHFSSVRLDRAGLPSLQSSEKIESLEFSQSTIHDEGLACLKGMTQLQGLQFYCCLGITDRGMVHIADLKNLKSLKIYREDSLHKADFKGEVVTDAGLEHLQGLTELEYLNLMGQNLTDAGLERLKGLTKLKQLFLSGKGITDAGLDHLKAMSQLTHLHLFDTRVTPSGRDRLKTSIPSLKPQF